MLSRVRELLWPILDYGSEATKQVKEMRRQEILRGIGQANWQDQDIVLEEARRLVSREDERRRTADTKATIYLAVLAAIVPLLLSFAKDISNYFDALQGWQAIVLVVLFLTAIVYLLGAGAWTFRILSVSTHDRVDVEELLELGGSTDTASTLIRNILVSVMNSRKFTNDKVNRLLMAHAFLVRTFVTFILLVVYLACITVYNYLYESCNFDPGTLDIW